METLARGRLRVIALASTLAVCFCFAFAAAAIAQSPNQTGGSGDNPGGITGSKPGSSGQSGDVPGGPRGTGEGGAKSAGGGVGTGDEGGIEAWQVAAVVVLVLGGVVLLARMTRKSGPGTGAGETAA